MKEQKRKSVLKKEETMNKDEMLRLRAAVRSNNLNPQVLLDTYKQVRSMLDEEIEALEEQIRKEGRN